MEENLKKLGLNEKEISVYKTILEYGKVLPATVSRLTGINRTTIYAVAKELTRKGLIAEELAGKSGYFVALSPTRLVSMIERDEREIVSKKKLAQVLAQDLSNITAKARYSVPKIRFIEEDNLEEFLYEQMLKWNEASEESDGVWGFQDHTFAETFQKWIEWAAETFKMKVRLLSNDSLIEKKMTKGSLPNRDIEFFLPNADFSASLWVVGPYIVMIRTREKPFYLVEIHDQAMAHNLKEVFKNIWEDHEGAVGSR